MYTLTVVFYSNYTMTINGFVCFLFLDYECVKFMVMLYTLELDSLFVQFSLSF